MKLEVIFFDLFYTLIKLNLSTYNESEVLGIDRKRWNDLIENKELYNLRATGVITEPLEIMKDLVNRLDIEASPKEIQEMTTIRLNRFGRAVVHVEEKVLEVLETVKSKGIKLCLISNADAIDVYHWQSSPLSKLFDEVLFSYEEGLVKPDKQIYLNALERMKVSPENALFVGDGGSQELMGAKSLGIGTVQTNHFMKNAEFKHTGVGAYADYTIMDMEELLDVIKEVTNE